MSLQRSRLKTRREQISPVGKLVEIFRELSPKIPLEFLLDDRRRERPRDSGYDSVAEISLRVLFGALRDALFEAFPRGVPSKAALRRVSRGGRSRTGVADAKKFHRELHESVTRRAEGVGEDEEEAEEEEEIADAQTRNTVPPW